MDQKEQMVVVLYLTKTYMVSASSSLPVIQSVSEGCLQAAGVKFQCLKSQLVKRGCVLLWR